MTRWLERGWRGASFAAVVVLLGILLTRILQQPLQPFRTAKVPFVQHGIRLRALAALDEVDSWNPLEIYRVVDGDYAPGVHLVSFVWGAVFGHAAESVVPSALIWLVLLAACVGASAYRLGASKQAALSAALFTAVLPCVHGAATVYYYDLPFLALVWLAVLCLLPRPGGRPVAMGASGGLAFVAACLAKWSALPMGSPFIAGALLCGVRSSRRERLIAGLVCAVTVCGLLALVLSSSDASLQDTLRSQADPTAHEESILGLRTKPNDLLPRAAYLGVHFFSSVLSPVLAVPLFLLAALWLLRDRRGLPLVVMAGISGLAFAGVLAADEDERLLVPAATLLALCAGLALDRIGEAARARWIAAGVVALGLLVAWDFHHSPRAAWNTEVLLFSIDDPGKDPARLRGLGAVSSIESLGWNRRDETPDVPGDLLQAVSDAFRDDPGSPLLVTAGAEGIGLHSVWFEYQHLLAYRRGERRRADGYQRTGPPCGNDNAIAPFLLMVPGEEFPDCLRAEEWQEDLQMQGNSLVVTRLRRKVPPATAL